MRRLSLVALFLALFVLAVGGWVVEALRWPFTLGSPRSGDRLVTRPAR